MFFNSSFRDKSAASNSGSTTSARYSATGHYSRPSNTDTPFSSSNHSTTSTSVANTENNPPKTSTTHHPTTSCSTYASNTNPASSSVNASDYEKNRTDASNFSSGAEQTSVAQESSSNSNIEKSSVTQRDSSISLDKIKNLVIEMIQNQNKTNELVRIQQEKILQLQEMLNLPLPPVIPEEISIPVFYDSPTIDDFVPFVIKDLGIKSNTSLKLEEIMNVQNSFSRKNIAIYCINAPTDRLEEFLSASRFTKVKSAFSKVIIVCLRSGKNPTFYKKLEKVNETCLTFYYYERNLRDDAFNVEQFNLLKHYLA